MTDCVEEGLHKSRNLKIRHHNRQTTCITPGNIRRQWREPRDDNLTWSDLWHNAASYELKRWDLNNTNFTDTEQLLNRRNITFVRINILFLISQLISSSVIELLISSPRYRNSETYRMSLSPILSNGKVLAINPSRCLGWKKRTK